MPHSNQAASLGFDLKCVGPRSPGPWLCSAPNSLSAFFLFFQLGVRHSPLSGEPKALQGPREVSGQGCQKFTRGVLGSGAGEQEAVQVQVQGHLGHLGRTQVEVSEQSFIQHLGWERQRPSKF